MGVQTDTLFVAMTRPASRWGVSLEWLTLYVVVSMTAFVGANSFWAFAIIPPAHVAGVIAFRKDPYFLSILAVWIGSCLSSSPRRVLRRAIYTP